MKIEKSLVSGSMMLLILRLLEEKDMYGYEMIEALREKSQNVFELKAGTLYPLLHGLEEKNFVTSYEQKVMGKERKYYRLTAAGHGRLEEKKDVPTQLRHLFASQTKRGLIDEVSLEAIDKRWRHLLSLPVPDKPIHGDLERHFEEVEEARKATVATLG